MIERLGWQYFPYILIYVIINSNNSEILFQFSKFFIFSFNNIKYFYTVGWPSFIDNMSHISNICLQIKREERYVWVFRGFAIFHRYACAGYWFAWDMENWAKKGLSIRWWFEYIFWISSLSEDWGSNIYSFVIFLRSLKTDLVNLNI